MNCQAVQNKILALPDPRHVPDPLRGHVAGCAACRAWAEHAARLEGLLERLPVPPAPADKKAVLLADLSRPAVTEPAPRRASAFEFVRRNAALVGGLAAAVLIASGAWLFSGKAGPNPEVAEAPPPRDPFLEKMVQLNVALAKADTHAKKLEVLGAQSDTLTAEARSLARLASPDELKDFVRWYEKTKTTLVDQAAKYNAQPLAADPVLRKKQLADLARKLEATAAEMRKAAGEVPPGAKPVLERIADTARDGQAALQKLVG